MTTRPIDDLPMPPEQDGSKDHDTLTRDIEVQLQAGIQALIDLEMHTRRISRRNAALRVVQRLKTLLQGQAT